MDFGAKAPSYVNTFMGVVSGTTPIGSLAK
jgi:hypothetical protein